MEASTSRSHPATPSHNTLLPSLSPSNQMEPTPAPLHTLPAHLQPTPSSHHSPPVYHTPTRMMGPPATNGTPTPAQRGQEHKLFTSIMGSAPGQVPASPVTNARVYASVYSGIPVYEAMIRGISVMRRTADSWVNATQILKVAGIPKSSRTKILDKEVAAGIHEKVQGGYGKYQGTWVPFERGLDLATQYGVTSYLAPILDFHPVADMLTALPVARGDTPSRPSSSAGFNGNYMAPPSQHQDNGASMMLPYQNGPMQGHPQHPMHHPPAPQWTGEHMMFPPPHPSMSYGGHQQPNAYYHQGPHPHYPGQPLLTPSHSNDNLAPAVELDGLLTSKSDVYHDEFGHAHPVHVAMTNDVDMEPPAKKQKPEPVVQEEEDDDDDLVLPKQLPTSMMLATKPSRSRESSSTQAFKSKLLGLFREDIDNDVGRHLGLVDGAPQDVDIVIDDNGHTALHWAASLGKISIVEQLIRLGADIHRGNVNGETPLARALLTANNAESGTLTELLGHLAPSIRTIDRTYRTVIHHIALVSSVPGRASYARTYLTGILEWVAKGQVSSASPEQMKVIGTKMNLKSLVDVQDEYGDTALIVAARAGNKGIVKLLLDAGADKTKANKMGLKAVDFGVEVEALALTPAESVVANLKSETSRPERHSRDVQKNIAAIFDNINETFSTEMTAKQKTLNQTEQNVRHATRSLADKRQQMQRSQSSLTELEQNKLKVEKLRKALSTTDSHTWTGRSGDKNDSAAFRPLAPRFAPQVAGSYGRDFPMPFHGEPNAVVTLRRRRDWETRIAQVLEQRVKALEGEGLDKELKYRRLVSVCTKVPVDKVDNMLDQIQSAIKSDGAAIDLSRIPSFISRIKSDGGNNPIHSM